MAGDRNTSMPEAWKVTREMMQHPQSRIIYIEPGKIPDELKAELEPIYAKSKASWGAVPRYYQMLTHSPALITSSILRLDQMMLADIRTTR